MNELHNPPTRGYADDKLPKPGSMYRWKPPTVTISTTQKDFDSDYLVALSIK